MSSFIKLTSYEEGEPSMYLNIDSIERFYREHKGRYTCVYVRTLSMRSSSTYPLPSILRVVESPEKIIGFIKEAKLYDSCKP